MLPEGGGHIATAAAPERGLGTVRDQLRRLSSVSPVDHRLALVVQGGAMRGIYSMAALSVLEEEGLRDAFTYVVGSSAGAINGAYFVAGQAREALSIYTDELAGGEFVSPLRFWKILDVDHLVDEVLKDRHPLDVEAMRAARPSLFTVLTDADTAEAAVVSSQESKLDLFEVLRATAACPGLYNRRVTLGSRRYIDGGIASLVPLEIAYGLGATGALVLLTRDLDHRRRVRGRAYEEALRVLPAGRSKSVRSRLSAADPDHDQTIAALKCETQQAPRKTWTLCPSSKTRLVGRTTDDRERLWDCVELARADMRRLLDQPSGGAFPPPRPGEPGSRQPRPAVNLRRADARSPHW
ncbi:MAG TPA: patatin-like phospholipase family protein [Acidimicrobiales bacterium]|nr:patatin-like phospholipase family protein [Acidimicrobiales bacterium]